MADPPFHSFPPPADATEEHGGDDDDALMARMNDGDRSAFETLVRRYGLRLAKYTTKLTSSPRLGVELASETWLSVWAHRARYPGDGRFIPFVLTIAKRKATGAIAKSQPDGAAPEVDVDIEAQLAAILPRLDDPAIQKIAEAEAQYVGTRGPKVSSRHWRIIALLGGVVLLAACLVFFLRALLAPRASGVGSMAKDVHVNVYTMPGSHPLTDSTKVNRKAEFSSTYTSAFPRRAYVLVFAVDAAKEIHWIAPAFTDIALDPSAVEIERADTETPLRSSVTFEVADGKLSVFAIVTERLIRVSDIERVPSTDRTADRIRARFSDGAIHEWKIAVARK